MTKIIILVTSDRLHDSFVKANLFDEISANNSVQIINGNDLIDFKKSILANMISRPIVLLRHKISKFTLDYFTYKFHQNNISFETRLRRFANLDSNLKFTTLNFMKTKNFRLLILHFLHLECIHYIASFFLINISTWNFDINKFMKKMDASHLVILSGGSFSNIENTFMRYSKKHNIKIGLIVDNWDNLSSKSLFFYKPDLVGVWGQQMLNDAKEIQYFEEYRIRIIGSSRIDRTFSSKLEKSSNSNLLFVGSGRSHTNELDILKMANGIASKFNAKIIYRPHPLFEADPKLINEIASLQNVAYSSDFDGYDNFQRPRFYSSNSIKSLVNDILNCNFTLAFHTTVIIESLYLGRPVLACSFSDDIYFRNGNVWDSYKHLKDLRETEGLREIKDIAEFDESLEIYIKSYFKNTLTPNYIPNIIPTFKDNYKNRLNEFLDELLAF